MENENTENLENDQIAAQMAAYVAKMIEMLKEEIQHFEDEKNKVIIEIDSFRLFLGNLSDVSSSLMNLSTNLSIVHTKATSGIISEEITPELNGMAEYKRETDN